jgi:hypothetical protein
MDWNTYPDTREWYDGYDIEARRGTGLTRSTKDGPGRFPAPRLFPPSQSTAKSICRVAEVP